MRVLAFGFRGQTYREAAAMNFFVDMDGVLADFAQRHQTVFGWRPEKEDNVDWAAVRKVEDFYLNIPRRTCNCFGRGSSPISRSF